MIVGLILAGCVIGDVAALIALVLGQTIWMALLIYSGASAFGVLAGAVIASRRGDPAPRPDTETRSSARPQRG